jgi:pimeloyl-ACP methyl ester carboxylesterase
MVETEIVQSASQSFAVAHESWGEGEALVFVHGFGTDREVMRDLAQALGQGRRVVLLDLRGHGASGVPSEDSDEAAYGYPTQCGDLIAVIDALGLDRVHWIGHSMGGQLALMAALRAPDRTRSLVAMGAGPNRPVVEDREKRAWARAAAQFEAMASDELARALAAAAPRIAAVPGSPGVAIGPSPEDDHRFYARARGTELARIVRGAFLPMRDNADACRGLEVPALVIAGQEDAQWLEPSRTLAALLPQSELHELAAAGHLAHLEKRDVVVKRIGDFLLRHTAKST